MAALTDEKIEQLILEMQKYPHLFIFKRGEYKYALKEEDLMGGGQLHAKTMNISAVVDATFVDIYVDTKNIPTCQYDI